MQKPPKLRRGDKIAVVAPSSCAGAFFPERAARGAAMLEALGLRVELMPSLKRRHRGSAGTPQERAAEINRVFTDQAVRGVIAAIGGTTANQILPLLDFDLIRANPKIFCGYSDITLLHCALAAKAELVTFYGPALLTQFAEFPEPWAYTVDHFRRALFDDRPLGRVAPAPEWTDEFLDWAGPEAEQRARRRRAGTAGHLWVQKGSAAGSLVGGCLPSLLQLKGTSFSPDYRGKILLIDTPEADSEPGRGWPLGMVECALMDLRLAGVFDQIAGLVVGRPYGCPEDEERLFVEVLQENCAPYHFPVLANVNTGHCDPVLTLPLYVTVRLDSAEDHFSIEEAGVA